MPAGLTAAADALEDACVVLHLSSCPDTPEGGCRTAAKSTIQSLKKSGGLKDKFAWKWLKGTSTSLAEFADPNNNPGGYDFSAATANVYNVTNRVVSLPYDLMHIYTDQPNKIGAPLADRTQILSDVLDYFNLNFFFPGPVPDAAQFAVANYPNPFNPATKISYVVPRAGHLSLKIFNVRGELVRTLVDGQVEASGDVMWDGTNNQGGAAASGVYFYEARLGNEVRISKMALIK